MFTFCRADPPSALGTHTNSRTQALARPPPDHGIYLPRRRGQVFSRCRQCLDARGEEK
jgi:hypothetical protein